MRGMSNPISRTDSIRMERNLSYFPESHPASTNLGVCSRPQDLRVADLARQELAAILTEIESAWHSEGRRMASRADWLKNESADHFEKMSPGALQRMRSDSDGGGRGMGSSREQSQDDDEDEDLSSA